MNPLSLLIIAGLVGLIVVGALVAVSTCREVSEHLLPGTVVGKTTELRETERTRTIPACPACPGSQPQKVTEVVSDELYYITVAVEDEEASEHRIPVSKREYGELAEGDTVQVRLTRSVRDGRLCSAPAIVDPATTG